MQALPLPRMGETATVRVLELAAASAHPGFRGLGIRCRCLGLGFRGLGFKHFFATLSTLFVSSISTQSLGFRGLRIGFRIWGLGLETSKM